MIGTEINIKISSESVKAAANKLAERLTPEVLNAYCLRGIVTADGVENALVCPNGGWLLNYMTKLVQTRMDLWQEILTNPTSTLNCRPFFRALADYVEDVEPGCFCATCYKPCNPIWSDSEDAFVPDCHTHSDLLAHPSDTTTMEQCDILRIVDASEIDKFRASVKDLRETAMDVS